MAQCLAKEQKNPEVSLSSLQAAASALASVAVHATNGHLAATALLALGLASLRGDLPLLGWKLALGGSPPPGDGDGDVAMGEAAAAAADATKDAPKSTAGVAAMEVDQQPAAAAAASLPPSVAADDPSLLKTLIDRMTELLGDTKVRAGVI